MGFWFEGFLGVVGRFFDTSDPVKMVGPRARKT